MAIAVSDRLWVLLPEPGWRLSGFVREETVPSSRIDGTQAPHRDVAPFKATGGSNE